MHDMKYATMVVFEVSKATIQYMNVCPSGEWSSLLLAHYEIKCAQNDIE